MVHPKRDKFPYCWKNKLFKPAQGGFLYFCWMFQLFFPGRPAENYQTKPALADQQTTLVSFGHQDVIFLIASVAPGDSRESERL